MEAKKLLIFFWTVALATFSAHGDHQQVAESNFLEVEPPFLESRRPKSDVIKSAITNSGDQKLVKNVNSFQVNNAKTDVDSYVTTSQLASIWRQQGAKFQELELKIQDCRNKDADYKQLAQRLFELETRLNLTIQENIDLRTKVDILQQDDPENSRKIQEKSSNHRRSPRMLKEDSFNTSNDISTDFSQFHKTRSVAFDAYRSKPFDIQQSIVTFDNTSVNVGEAFNVTNGIFTAPFDGIYAFNFHALTRDGSATYVKIQKNNENVGGAYRRHEGEGDEMHETEEADRTFTKAEGMLAQSVILDLKENDNVSVYAYHGNIRDGGWHYTHFTGYLLF